MLALIVGLGIGIVVGLLGAGGGILSVPALMYLLGQAPYAAAIGSLIGVTLTSAGALLVHARAGSVQIRAGLLFGGLSVVGALAGARLSLLLDDEMLVRIFSIFLLLVGIAFAVRTWRGPTEDSATGRPRRRWRDLMRLIIVASLTGLLTGIFGVGGGFMIVPVLVLVMAVPMKEAVGTSLLVMVVTSLAGIVGRMPLQGTIDWQLIGLFVAGSVMGGLLGSVFSKRLPPRLLTGIFALLVTGVAVYSGIQSWL
ncbi:sulfite exporter TauE/SafE family protein [Flaviflexus salsibiostraticola]|uniref:Probable membrane transporter protein n=1 Tax=Flaviflexus salsibiostraticola TaxID=1282737 RepID=A0A3Q8WTW3_9ACTO|nr:sulfite exporter TauE/SafE family protein [Flaviflexus salsibiostraticola]AZN29141.1 sulfite exporter TauE/SafE family protein [Flaviflexus salsibiostraticola]